MNSQRYSGSHQAHFETFVQLVDDSATHAALILDLLSGFEFRTLLSIGGGQGRVEASLLQHATKCEIWFLDPSLQQGQEFSKFMKKNNLEERVKEVALSTFQDYHTNNSFDCIVAMFSWYFMGPDPRWLKKLLHLLSPRGKAFIVLPNQASIFAAFTRHLSPNTQMTLVGDEVLPVLSHLSCAVKRYTTTKWLAHRDLFDQAKLSEASLAFAAFIAERSMVSFSVAEKANIHKLLLDNAKPEGIPIISDVILIER